jgi:hypothetical protein
MMISKICGKFTLFGARVSVLEAREYPYSARDNFDVVVDRHASLSFARTSPLTLVRQLNLVVVVAALIQTQRRGHYNSVAATFISMSRQSLMLPDGYRGVYRVDGSLY